MSENEGVSNQIVHEINRGAEEVRSAAAALHDRVVQFERWLSTLRGKVYASCVLWQENDGPGTTHELIYRKDGKEWSLYLGTSVEIDPESGYSDLRPLRDASIEEKVNAIRHFPALLAAIRKSQQDRVAMADQAAVAFDAFAKEIGIAPPLDEEERVAKEMSAAFSEYSRKQAEREAKKGGK